MGVLYFPQIPQTVKIFTKVTPGTRFIFVGKCEDRNFSFALLSENNIAILLEFILENQKIIRAKSFQGGQWSNEKITKNPIRPNGSFFLQIIAGEDEFEVYLSEKRILSLKHSVPLGLITGIRIMETMKLDRIEMEEPVFPAGKV